MRITYNELRSIIKEELQKMKSYQSIFGDRDSSNLRTSVARFFKAAAVMAIYLGEDGDYNQFKAHDDIRRQAIEYFKALELLKRQFGDDEYRSSEDAAVIKDRLANLKSRYSDIQEYIPAAMKLYKKFLEVGSEFIKEYAALYNKEGHYKYHTDGHKARISCAQSFLSGGAELNGCGSLGILMRDFMAYLNGKNPDWWERRSEAGLSTKREKPEGEEYTVNTDLAAKNEAINAVTEIVNGCFRQISMDLQKESDGSAEKIREIIIGAVKQTARDNGLDFTRLFPCVQRLLLGDEAGARKYINDLARGYETMRSVKSGRINESRKKLKK